MVTTTDQGQGQGTFVGRIYGTIVLAATAALGNALGSHLTVPFPSDHEGFERSGLTPYTDDSEFGAVCIQSRALEALVRYLGNGSWYRKLKTI